MWNTYDTEIKDVNSECICPPQFLHPVRTALTHRPSHAYRGIVTVSMSGFKEVKV